MIKVIKHGTGQQPASPYGFPKGQTSRAAQQQRLRLLGNGVVPQQASAAYIRLAGELGI